MTDANRDRLEAAAAADLAPDSLVGSFFHSDDQTQMQGCVIAEVVPGMYLVELFEWFTGSPTHQALIPVQKMEDWRFYDSADWMIDHYENYVSRRWEKAERTR